jgi:hypothetical protein
VREEFDGKFEKGDAMIEYVGERIDEKEYERRLKIYTTSVESNYIVPTPVKGWFIDATMKGNWGRYVNHSCDPNCQMEDAYVDGEWKNMIVAVKDINPGDEITMNYGKDYKTVDGKFMGCKCLSENCSGIIGVKKENLAQVLLEYQEEPFGIRPDFAFINCECNRRLCTGRVNLFFRHASKAQWIRQRIKYKGTLPVMDYRPTHVLLHALHNLKLDADPSSSDE